MENQQLILLLGELKGSVKAVQETLKEYGDQIQLVHGRISEVKEVVGQLPCHVHTEQIEGLEKWQGRHNGAGAVLKVEKAKAGFNLKNSLILATFTFGGSIIGGVVVWWLTCGLK